MQFLIILLLQYLNSPFHRYKRCQILKKKKHTSKIKDAKKNPQKTMESRNTHTHEPDAFVLMTVFPYGQLTCCLDHELTYTEVNGGNGARCCVCNSLTKAARKTLDRDTTRETQTHTASHSRRMISARAAERDRRPERKIF